MDFHRLFFALKRICCSIKHPFKIMRGLVRVLVVIVFFSSCSSSLDVANKGFLQKRKYTKGWYVNSGHHVKKINNSIERSKVDEKRNPDKTSVKQVSNSEVKKGNSTLVGQLGFLRKVKKEVRRLSDIPSSKKDGEPESKIFINVKKAMSPRDGIESDKDDDGNMALVAAYGLILSDLFLGLIPVFGILVMVAALVLALISLQKNDRPMLSILAIVLSLMFLVLVIVWNVFLFSVVLI